MEWVHLAEGGKAVKLPGGAAAHDKVKKFLEDFISLLPGW